MNDNNSSRFLSASFYRREAVMALHGKWKSALLVAMLLLLLSGAIFGAGCTYSTSTETAPYWTLEASIGPFTSVSLWKNGQLMVDAATQHNVQTDAILLPYSPMFTAAAALTSLLFLILSPIVAAANIRLCITVLDGGRPSVSLLHTTAREYWLMVRTELLVIWHVLWPLLTSAVLGSLCPSILGEMGSILLVLFLIAGFVLVAIRAIGAVAAPYFAVTRQDVTAREALTLSRELMNGRKWRFTCLGLSFFGWLLLSALAISIAAYLLPAALNPLTTLLFVPVWLYMLVAQMAFFRHAEKPDALSEKVESEPQPDSALPAPVQEDAPQQQETDQTPNDPWA